MGKKLVIVESPAKAKTINKFLGSDFEVTSSYGHIRDLPSSGLAIDLANNYEPEYEISPDKVKMIGELRKMAKSADDIYLATDEDREGEAIAWHLCSVLNLDPKKAKRITYTEITEKAVKNAVANPRTINLDLVNAQQARRVLDRLVGYELSPVLWKKVKPSLSAGRVQSVAVRLIVEREREINQFNSNSYFKISALFEVKDGSKTTLLKAESNSRPQTESVAAKYLNDLVGANFSVKGTEKKPTKRTPAAPFTTSTLQQEASRKLSFSVSKTMQVAQRLYEAGHITYMRTDSNSLSELALNSIASEINNKYGAKYQKRRQYATKNQSAQEAHEAIRPSYIANVEVSGDRDEQRLYELIWKRTIASQMSDAELEKTIITVQNNKNESELHATGEVVLFDGFLKVYTESVDDENESEDDESVLLPPLKNGMELPLRELSATERFTRPQPRYTEASLVKKLEELGIGRPSTYAPTI
ncbi:MAG TPA: type I DNA topoisomerase, partial [Chitinophagales bacterium]